jgi:cytochrome oxidase Cu insertion factor (SCO1/SenC/PrrC family)
VKSPGSAAPRLLGAALIILAAGLLGYFAYHLKRGRDSAAPQASASVTTVAPDATAPPAVPPPVAQAKKAIPDTLPDVTLADRDGKPTTLASFGGRPLMVNFLGHLVCPVSARNSPAQ